MKKIRSPKCDIIPDIAKEVAEELGIDLSKIPLSEVEKVVNSEFKFAKHVITSGQNRNVRLLKWGTFGVHKRNLKRLQALPSRKEVRDLADILMDEFDIDKAEAMKIAKEHLMIQKQKESDVDQ